MALGTADGTLVDGAAWEAGHRHGEELLPRLQALLAAHGTALASVRGVVVGTGPGAFTGLRVGIATAKALAHGLGALRSSASPTAAALLPDRPAALDGGAGTDPSALCCCPAGPSDRVLVSTGTRALLPAGADRTRNGWRTTSWPSTCPVGRRRPPSTRGEAGGRRARRVARPASARRGWPRATVDDLARLVPEYVTLPRGVISERGEVAWSHGPR